MVFKKLLHLLRKDALLLWRSKVWTAFEILLPLILIAAPPLLILALTKGKDIDVNHMQGRSDSTKEKLSPDFIVYCDGHSSRPRNIDHVYDDIDIIRSLPVYGGKTNRWDFIEKARDCENVVYFVEKNMSSTIAIKGKGNQHSFDFNGYMYYMNKIIFGIYEANGGKIDSLSDIQTMQSLGYSIDDNELHTLPKVDEMKLGQAIILIFPFFYGICLAMPVIAATRNLLVEKDSVKPYLSTMGLPIWLFYLEHFIFGVLKTTVLITLTSLIWCACVTGFPGYILVGIFFYTFNCIAFAIFVSTIFSSAKRAVEGMVLIWLALVIFSLLYTPTGAMAYVISLNPTHALKNYIGAVIWAYAEDEISFGDLFKSNVVGFPPAAVYLAFMIFNTIWMLVAAIFMEKLFAFLGHVIFKHLWGVLSNRKNKTKSGMTSRIGVDKSTILDVQETLEGRTTAAADIELSGLVKVYPNGEKAVNGLSLRAVRGQVSILLGHNGCGKSTTFGMITGMHKPTEGKVMIAGVDANKKRSEARKLIGYCPQYNPIYEKLTVMEHLRLAEAMSLLEQIELTDKKDTLAKKLSGGMKRKLCVCMAMIGGSRVILLDEPTAGMDPAARIDVQKMLALVKADRTILLTTHYMDEAEKLGDWVFVMSHGKMAASGSIHFLKQKYGGGMLLTLVFKTSSDPKKSYERALNVCKAICPTATVKDERGQMMEISIAEREKGLLPRLFRALEAITERNFNSPDITSVGPSIHNQAQNLDIVTVGVSMSSLEQVFIKIGDECDMVINKNTGSDTKAERKKRFAGLIKAKKQPPKQGYPRKLMTLTALLQKRAYYIYRNPIQICLQIILPLATLWLLANTFKGMVSSPASKKMVQIESLDLSEFPQSTVILQMEKSDKRILDYLHKFSNLNVMEVSYDLDINEVVKKYAMGFSILGFVLKVNKKKISAIYFNEQMEEKSKNKAILTNLLSSAMYLHSNIAKELPRISSNIYWMMDSEGVSKLIIMDVVFMLPTLSLILAGVIVQSIVYLIEERVCKFTHQQYLTGLSSFAYWGIVFLWDFLLFTFIVFYTLIFIWAFGVFAGHVHEIVILFYCFLFYMAPVVYLTSNLINSPTKGSFLLYIFMIVTYFACAICFITIGIDGEDKDKEGIKWGFRIASPSVGLFLGIIKVTGVTYEHSGLAKKPFDEIESSWEFNGILIEILFLLGFALLMTAFLCCTTLKPIRRSCFSVFHRKSKPKSRVQYKGIESCSAVKEEEELIPKVDPKDKVIVVDGLIKDFGSFRAINGLSVSVGHEECFGMLGANGAGKTTTFDIITGLTMPTGGNVTIDGKDITKDIHIGYCPQFDAMLQQISCRQTLIVMAKLQGYPNVNEVVEMILECVGMKEHGNKLVKNCSGGQKRKISVGIALMSRAHCIILDEPTAGIDPRARREIWDIIHEMREQDKCSIVLTSHSMEECEALCTRIGILRKGEMIALGTSQSLKSQYGNTYMMTLVLYQIKHREAVCKKVSQEMPEAVLKTPESSLTTSLVWEIPKKKSDKWSEKYSEVEALAKKANAKDYMLAQASLEDTFIRLITTD
ncbi:hypothetical protein L5515_002087 [Caenorhabditis briggsae]|uniref:ABC transporter domain-containing protein n=1 Tax=Caenorhabditis briggsae TaxID=6238 RepID=A0AAE9J3T8_CAEBR|nr:hypothetical protein L5515_002087 [Caenorhabditis briggsae]